MDARRRRMGNEDIEIAPVARLIPQQLQRQPLHAERHLLLGILIEAIGTIPHAPFQPGEQ